MIEGADLESSGGALRLLLSTLGRRRWTVVAVAAVAVAASLAYSLAQSGVYRAQAKLVVTRGNAPVGPQVRRGDQPLAATMRDLLRSEIVAANVVQGLRLEGTSTRSLLGEITVRAEGRTAALTVSVDDGSPQRAAQIVQEVANVFSQLVNERFGHAQVGAAGPAALPLTVTIWDPAHLVGKVAPRTARNVLVAGLLGLVLGLLAALLQEQLDRSLRTRRDVERALGVPVVGRIPPGADRRRREPAVEALRTGLRYLEVGRPLHTIVVTSASRGQGTTTVVADLSAALAASGSAVVALDCDLLHGDLHESCGVAAGGSGITGVLLGLDDLDAALLDVPVSPANRGGRLALLPGGTPPPSPGRLLGTLPAAQLLERLAAMFDDVVVDLPPLLGDDAALDFARAADGVLVVVARGRTSDDEARALRELAQSHQIRLVGAVLTGDPAGIVAGEPA